MTDALESNPFDYFRRHLVPVCVTARTNPDVDGVACAIAYAELLRRNEIDAWPLVDGRPDAEARYVIDALGRSPDMKERSEGAFVLVDASDVRGLPKLVDPARVIEVIDHRLHHEAETLFAGARIQIEPVGAAATLIAERWRNSRVAPSVRSVRFLEAAILSNTQRLCGSVTTPRDHESFRWLATITELPMGMIDGQFAARTSEILSDVREALVRESKLFDHGTGAFTVTQLELLNGMELINSVIADAASLGSRTIVNIVDVGRARSVLIVLDPLFREWVANHLTVTFDGVAAIYSPAVLRKQIVARIHGAMK